MRNHIILEMSTLPNGVENKNYNFFYKKNDGDVIKVEGCKGQLEPIPRLMMKCNPNDEEFIIYAMCSHKTLAEELTIADKKYTAISYFKERIENCAEVSNGNKKVRFVTVEIEDMRNPYKALTEVVNVLRDEYKESDRLWIDTHGGLRDISQIISAMVSMLKVYSIVPEEIFGIEINFTGESEIYSHKEAFNIFNYVSGMDDFVNFGSTRGLEKYYKDSKNETARVILSAMDKIAGGTQLCDPGMYTEGIEELRDSIANIHDDPLLSIFADYIKKDYGEELIPSEPELARKEVSPLAIIKRCVDKRLYQQALTFLESKMPGVYANKGFIFTKSMNDFIKERDEKKKKYMAPENYLFDSLLYNITKNDKETSNEAKIVEMSQYYEKGKRSINGGPFQKTNIVNMNNLFLYPDGKKTQVMSKLKPSEEKIFIQLMYMHWELKRCRNLFNHGNSERPQINDIDNALKLYIMYAEELLKKRK